MPALKTAVVKVRVSPGMWKAIHNIPEDRGEKDAVILREALKLYVESHRLDFKAVEYDKLKVLSGKQKRRAA